MAWGKQRFYRQDAWERRHDIAALISRLRDPTNPLGRKDAFSLFQNRNAIRGLGPSYFTKLLYFCGVNGDHWIMDQWTAKSVNLLFGKVIVPMRGDAISPAVTAEHYVSYCDAVDQIAQRIGSDGSTAEIRLFDQGGRLPGYWRAYVKEHS